jgi:hypothetical protein
MACKHCGQDVIKSFSSMLMRILLPDRLKEVSSKYFLEEKILICPSFEIGQQIIADFSRHAGRWANLKVETVHSLAAQIIEPILHVQGIQAISRTETVFLIDHIFAMLFHEGALSYFKKHVKNSGIIHALSDNILLLKSAGIRFDQVTDDCFIDRDKASDLRLIYKTYAQQLRQRSLADPADAIDIAAQNIEDCHRNKRFILLAKYAYTKNQVDFLKKLTKDRLDAIAEKELPGLDTPKNRLARSLHPGALLYDHLELGSLFDLSAWAKRARDDDKDPDIALFCAEDAKSEIYEVLKAIAKEKCFLDDVEIIYTDEEEYLGLIDALLRKTDIPVVFPSGFPGDSSRTGKCLKGFLLWVKDDFLEIHLRKLLRYRLIHIKEGPVSCADLWHVLRSSNIGWGRDRYQTVIAKSIDACRTQMGQDGANQAYVQKKIDCLLLLGDLCRRLLGIVPEVVDGHVVFRDLCICCKDFLKDFIHAKSEEEAAFAAGLLKSIGTLENIADTKILLEEGIHKIIEVIRQERFSKKGPRPGHLLVSSLSSGGNSGRGNTFIVGMDAHKFCGMQIQDPVLLDAERKKISSMLPLSNDKLKERLYDFTSMVSSLRGKVTFSHASYAVKEQRSLFPSSVLLQVYRCKSRKADSDYKDLIAYMEKSGHRDCRMHFDDSSRWFDKIIDSDRLMDAKEAVLGIYPWLKEGTEAQAKRRSSRLTAYDGWIGPVEELDPRKNRDLVLSCTAIERYAQSPFAFFLNSILGIKRPQETKRDMSFWLDAAQKGSLLHEVYDRFVKTLSAMDTVPDEMGQRRIINQVLDDTIARYKEEIPVPSLSVFDREVTYLKRDIDVFIQANQELEDAHFSELVFGYMGKDPLKIGVGDGAFISVRGKIDRVDMDKEGNYHVWDYKTGSTYAYAQDAYVCGGKQLQHILYAKAFEELIKGQKVARCGYLFPTEKGRDSAKGLLFARDPDEVQKWQEPLHLLLDLMASGFFIMSDEEDPPFIDDADMYGSKEDKQNIRFKMKQSQNELFEKWQRLRAYP